MMMLMMTDRNDDYCGDNINKDNNNSRCKNSRGRINIYEVKSDGN